MSKAVDFYEIEQENYMGILEKIDLCLLNQKLWRFPQVISSPHSSLKSTGLQHPSPILP